MVLGQLCCGECGTVVKEDEHVVLTDLHTIIHHLCFYKSDETEKDTGTFQEMINKYDFLVLDRS